MLNKNVIRIIAIVMAALMVIGVFGAAISAFAVSPDVVISENPATGQPVSWTPIIVGAVALIVAIICVVLSKKKNNVTEENIEKDYINEEEVESGLNFFTSKKDDIVVKESEETLSDETASEEVTEDFSEETDSIEE